MGALKTLGTVLFFLGIGVSGVFASRHVTVEVAEGEQASGMAKIEAWSDAAGLGFGIGAAMMIGGGIMTRAARRASRTSAKAGASGVSVEGLLEQIRARLAELPDDPKAGAKAMKEGLDEVLEELIPQVLDQREAMIDHMGLGDFAEAIGHFATMERNAARAWSALIDDCPEEIPECLDRARVGLDKAIETMGTGA